MLGVAALAAGCGGAAASGDAPTTSSASGQTATSANTTQTTQTTPQVDPAIVKWASQWKHKVGKPARRAVARLAANAPLAVAGNTEASYRLTAAVNVLSNCRVPLDTSMADTPPDLQHARTATKAACRMIYVGTDRVIQGLNAQSSSMVAAGVQRVRRGLARLMRAGHEVDQAAMPK
jgi:hypothetical protein